MGLSMGVMIIGYDKKGPGLYYVDSDGSRCEPLVEQKVVRFFADPTIEIRWKQYDAKMF
jgi:hypothetical protein